MLRGGPLVAAALGLFVVACAAGGGSPAPAPSGSAGDAPSAAPATAPRGEACAIEQPPGAVDAPPVGGETDTAGQGPGRWRICLTAPAPITTEASAWCTWNTDRTSVDDVSGLPSTVNGVAYDAFLSFVTSKLEVHLTDEAHGGLIANYVPRGPLPGATDSTHRGGTLDFDAELQVDPESGPPPGAPTTVGGRMVWTCADPLVAG